MRGLLTAAASRPRQDRAAELDAFRRMLRRKYGTLRDSTPDIRAERKARG